MVVYSGKGVTANVAGHVVGIGNSRLMTDLCGEEVAAGHDTRKEWSAKGESQTCLSLTFVSPCCLSF